MDLNEQRAIVATELMKYKQLDSSYPKRYFEPPNVGGWISKIEVDDYHPDLKDNESLGQRERLKERLAALKHDWDILCRQSEDYYECRIYTVEFEGVFFKGLSTVSEGAALLESASKLALELAKEHDHE